MKFSKHWSLFSEKPSLECLQLCLLQLQKLLAMKASISLQYNKNKSNYSTYSFSSFCSNLPQASFSFCYFCQVVFLWSIFMRFWRLGPIKHIIVNADNRKRLQILSFCFYSFQAPGNDYLRHERPTQEKMCSMCSLAISLPMSVCKPWNHGMLEKRITQRSKVTESHMNLHFLFDRLLLK